MSVDHKWKQKNCTVITEIDTKCCYNTVHAVNFRRELVIENATLGSLKVLEFHYQNIVGTLYLPHEDIIMCC